MSPSLLVRAARYLGILSAILGLVAVGASLSRTGEVSVPGAVALLVGVVVIVLSGVAARSSAE